jgi:hypothetical protein
MRFANLLFNICGELKTEQDRILTNILKDFPLTDLDFSVITNEQTSEFADK